ncbi:MAG: hypothetical protein Q9187_008392 [Circinaria calcarea]
MNTQPQGSNNAGQEDYMDKGETEVNRLTNHLPGLDAVEKKFGGGSVDPAKQRGMNEKITDGARSVLEKATGYVAIF